MRDCYVHSMLSTDEFCPPLTPEMFGGEIFYNECRANLLNEIGMNIATYKDQEGSRRFEPFKKAISKRMSILSKLFFREKLHIEGINFIALKTPVDFREIANIPKIQEFFYRSKKHEQNKKIALTQTLAIKEGLIGLNSLEEILQKTSQEIIEDINPLIPNLLNVPLERMYETSLQLRRLKYELLEPYGKLYGSRIFTHIFNEINEQPREIKLTPITCGYLNQKYFKRLFCKQSGKRGSGLINQHIFYIQELRKDKIINPKILWDGVLPKCLDCGGEIIPLPGEYKTQHFYVTKTLNQQINNETIEKVMTQAQKMGSESLELLNSIHGIELDKERGFEAFMSYPTRINFNNYIFLSGKPSTKQLRRGKGIVPFIICEKGGIKTERYLKTILETNINGSSGSSKTRNLANTLDVQYDKITKN